MFLHLGGDVVVPIKDIISIVDIASISKSKDSKEFLKVAEEEEFIVRISEEEPKSCIITEKKIKRSKKSSKEVKTVIYYSPISSVTLQKRTNFMDELHL
ncbi:extracellular matrix regulator RemB [Anaerosolibacter sp.]|uniref:extracellular matrix regulator RemB n=1 Tax=Anaerosolibacter sp. TaxID=1872527 RepID=UPI002629DC55|nr:extracellular matrix/biofilm biosynthesis regulator RemA family protein [Anaerosolibacter sp.]MDF2548648.1 hypothetical protein [Anaerosolibacter sp.]